MLPSVFTKKTLYQESVLRRPRTPPCAGVDILQYEEVANGAALDVALHTRGRGPVGPADGLWSRSKPERTFQSKASKLYSKTKSRKAFATSSKLKLVKERLTRAPEFFIRFYGEIHPTANCPWSSTSISLCGNRCQWPPCADQSVWERPIHSVVRGLEHATVLMGPMEFCRAPRQMLL